MKGLQVQVVDGAYGILRLDSDQKVPAWFEGPGGFRLSARTPDELTLLVPEADVPADFVGKQELGWRGMYVRGTLDFGLVGIMAGLSAALAGANVSILAISTFDTDWLFVKEADLERGLAALETTGILILR